ncbi:MAG: TldD/PmbA family protein [Candidatus Margulisbacteria bacterium]|nr:TldD/PmbA family protein [Candidatus Margulisiibacteriota bacterium]
MNELKKYLEYARTQGADEAEIFCASGREESVVVRRQELEKAGSAGDRGLAVRVICRQRAGFAYTSALAEEDIRRAVDMAVANAAYAAKDKWLGLPDAASARKALPHLRNYSPAAARMSLKQLADWARRAENAAYKYDRRICATEASTAFAAASETEIVNTRGIAARGRKTLCGVSLEIAAKTGDRMEAAYDFCYAAAPSRISPEKIGRTAATRAVRMLSAAPVKTGRYDLLLTRSVARDFLSVLSELFSAENVLRRKSLFRRKMGRQVASAKVTLIDDPLLPARSGSFLYDGEGAPARRRVLIKNGRLKDYFYDVSAARKCGVPYAGNAARASIFAEPSIGPSNLYFAPGRLSRADLAKSADRGLLIENIMGLHTADPVSGDFSFGASGRLITGGRLAAPVKDMAIAGNLLELLLNIKSCGRDLEFSGHYGAPSILIGNMLVAGQ